MMNTLAAITAMWRKYKTHVAAVVSAAVAAITAAHPGWHEPTWVNVAIPVAAGVVVVVVEVRAWMHRKAPAKK